MTMDLNTTNENSESATAQDDAIALEKTKITAPHPKIPSQDGCEAMGRPKATQSTPRTKTPARAGKATFHTQPSKETPSHQSATGGDVGQCLPEIHRLRADIEKSNGHPADETQIKGAVSRNDEANTATKNNEVSPVIAELIQLGRMRRRWHKAEKSLTLQGKAMARAWTEGDKDAANNLFDDCVKGKSVDPMLSVALSPFIHGREPFEIERKAIEKRMRKLARQLPVWQWAEGVRGLGDLRLAVIVGECGDIGSYKSVSALWKRMGLAVINGERQRKKAGDDGIIHGYNPERRAIAYVMGTEIIKAQIRVVKDDDGKATDERNSLGHLGALYLDRKAHEITLEGITKAHANNRAARYMVKRVFREMYAAWKAVEVAS